MIQISNNHIAVVVEAEKGFNGNCLVEFQGSMSSMLAHIFQRAIEKRCLECGGIGGLHAKIWIKNKIGVEGHYQKCKTGVKEGGEFIE